MLWMVQILICFFPFVMFDSKNSHLVKRKKERGTQYKNKTKTNQIVHARFNCHQNILKKIPALNSIQKSTTLTCQYISLCHELQRRRMVKGQCWWFWLLCLVQEKFEKPLSHYLAERSFCLVDLFEFLEKFSNIKNNRHKQQKADTVE